MKSNENFVRGPQAEAMQLMKDRVLVRVMQIEPKKKTKIIVPNAENRDAYDISDYQGFHPGLVEVLNANSPDAINAGVEDGAIYAISLRVFNLIMSGQADTLYVDKEPLCALHASDLLCKMNYYRENFKKGKIVKALK